MYRASLSFHQRLRSGARPLVILALDNAAGTRLYARCAPDLDSFGWTDVHLADGSYQADGSVQAGEGSQAVLTRRADLKSGARLTETLTPQRSDLLASLSGQEAGHLAVTLKNSEEPDGGRHFSRIIARENILGAQVTLRSVFKGLPGGEDALDRFRGRVLAFRLSREEITLELGAI